MRKTAGVLGKLDKTTTLDEAAKVLTEAGISYNRQKNRLDTAIIPHDLYGRLATLKPGGPFIIPVGGLGVASVIVSREPAAVSGDQARPKAVAAMRRTQASKVMQDRIKALRGTAKVEYKQGFAPPKK